MTFQARTVSENNQILCNPTRMFHAAPRRFVLEPLPLLNQLLDAVKRKARRVRLVVEIAQRLQAQHLVANLEQQLQTGEREMEEK